MRPVHPGEIPRDELDEAGLSANALSKALGVPANRVTAILNGRRGVRANTALRLALYFGTTTHNADGSLTHDGFRYENWVVGSGRRQLPKETLASWE